MATGRWRVAAGRWCVAAGRWRVAAGRWRGDWALAIFCCFWGGLWIECVG